MISGKFFNEICKWHTCPRYEQNFEVSSIQENDLIFINLDNFENFFKIISTNNPPKFSLITHNSDRDFNQNMFYSIKPFINKIYALNSSVSDELVTKIPLGFIDSRIDEMAAINVDKKENLIYINFHIKNHPDRQICINHFKKYDWANIEKSNETSRLSFTDYAKELNKHKYSACPRGSGIDTHRIYESLYFNVIPIVKNNELSDMYSNMPILLINDWSEITLELLNNRYDELYSKLINWKEKNKNWYKVEYWIN